MTVNVLVCVHARLCVFVCIYIKERERGGGVEREGVSEGEEGREREGGVERE